MRRIKNTFGGVQQLTIAATIPIVEFARSKPPFLCRQICCSLLGGFLLKQLFLWHFDQLPRTTTDTACTDSAWTQLGCGRGCHY